MKWMARKKSKDRPSTTAHAIWTKQIERKTRNKTTHKQRKIIILANYLCFILFWQPPPLRFILICLLRERANIGENATERTQTHIHRSTKRVRASHSHGYRDRDGMNERVIKTDIEKRALSVDRNRHVFVYVRNSKCVYRTHLLLYALKCALVRSPLSRERWNNIVCVVQWFR